MAKKIKIKIPEVKKDTTVIKQDEKIKEVEKENPTDFNIKAKTTLAGIKEKKLENCTVINDVKAYKEKYGYVK